MRQERYILGIDPGLANTGWGIISQAGMRIAPVAFGCVTTTSSDPLERRLKKIHDQIFAVVRHYGPTRVGIETIWFGNNVTSAFATGQARGAALVACAAFGLQVSEFAPSAIKSAVVGVGQAEKQQVQYMVQQLLGLEAPPSPDHAADALAAAICCALHGSAAADALADLAPRSHARRSPEEGAVRPASRRNASTVQGGRL